MKTIQKTHLIDLVQTFNTRGLSLAFYFKFLFLHAHKQEIDQIYIYCIFTFKIYFDLLVSYFYFTSLISL
jgi:hypothetical protein